MSRLIHVTIVGLCFCDHGFGQEKLQNNLWLGEQAPPKTTEIEQIEGVRFHVIQPRRPDVDNYNWLHGVALAWHGDELVASFGHNSGSENTASEVANGRWSADGGKSWLPLFTVDAGDETNLAVSHGVFHVVGDRLFAFQGSFHGRMQNVHTRGYEWQPHASVWKPLGVVAADGFWPMQPPVEMSNGNWIMAGLIVDEGIGQRNNPAGVAISDGFNFTNWRVVRIPLDDTVGKVWGESTVIVDGSRIVNISRYGDRAVALVSVSDDFGESWTMMRESNLPMAGTKPFAGILSTGQWYLIGTTTADGGHRRSPLTIAIGTPGERGFSRVLKIRDTAHEGPGESGPAVRLSYPYVIEHDGSLYVGYSNDGGRGGNRNSAELAVVPVSSLSR